MHHVSSYILKESSLKTQRTVLYYFCSSIASENPIVSQFVLALLCQFVRHSPKDRQKYIVGKFLQTIVNGIIKEEKSYYTELDLFKASSETWLKKIIDTPADTLWAALMAILANEPDRELLVIVDGLEKVEDETGEFIKGIRAFVDHLQERILNLKVLLTSRPLADIKEVFDGLPYIEHDKERRGNACASNYTIK